MNRKIRVLPRSFLELRTKIQTVRMGAKENNESIFRINPKMVALVMTAMLSRSEQ